MGKRKTAADLWLGTVVLAAAGLAAWGVHDLVVTSGDIIILGVLSLCAAIAHVFPIRSAADGASYRLTNVFVIAGAVILPPALLAPLVTLAIAPEFWARRHLPLARVLRGWLFNVAETAIAAHAASALMNAVGGTLLPAEMEVIALLAAAAVYTLLQALMVGIIIALSSNTPLSRAPTFSATALLGDAFIGALGIVVAGLWQARPALLVLIPAVLFMAHRMTRNAHLAHLAEVDTKTGLHNSRHFEQALEEELAHSLRVKRPLTVLFADLDHFKKVNDVYGHAAGDVVLRTVSGLLTELVRKGDLVARFGGEEFVILLPGTDAEEALFLAERVRSAVAKHEFRLDDGRTLQCTISVGLASCPENGTDIKQLLERADGAMYRAKRTRNAVARAEAEAPVPSLEPRAVVVAAASASAASVAAPAAGVSRPASGPAPSKLAPVMLWGTIGLGLFAAVASLVLSLVAGEWLRLIPLLLLAVAADFLKVQVYESSQQRIRLGFQIVVIMAAVALQPASAPLVALASAVMHVVATRQRQVDKALFNIANLPLAASAAAGVYFLLGTGGTGFSLLHLATALVAVIPYYLVNVGVISIMISLHSRRPLLSVFRESSWFAPTNILLGITGAFLGGSYHQLGPVGITMFIVPVLVMRFTLAFYARQTQRQIETLQAAKAEVEAAHSEKEEMLRKLIETVALIIDARDNSVSGHSRRVAKFAVAIGKELKMDASELAVIHTAGLFHDLGKVGIPEAILHKPAKLTADEYTVIKEHAALGSRILSEVPQLADIAKMVGEHHERFDGTGYPMGLAAEQITVGGRILVVADALETMLADRPYSKGRSLQMALDELDRCAGSHFDPDIVAAVHRAVRVQGADFFNNSELRSQRDWSAAEQLLAQVFP